MTTRLWFLIQLAPRFAASITLRHNLNLSLLARCDGSSKLWYSDHKPSSPSIELNPASGNAKADGSRVGNTASHSNPNPLSKC